MEGMASYMATDDSARDKMFLRDGVVNDQFSSTEQHVRAFSASPYGHDLFDFIKEPWGKEGFLDVIYEIRNTIGARVHRAVKRAFKLEPFFFSSRRRHTRFDCDWSSDVCSSD